MATCPTCGGERAAGAVRCPRCGRIFASAGRRPRAPRGFGFRALRAVLLGVLGGVVVAGVWAWKNLWPRWRALQDPYFDVRPVERGSIAARRDPAAVFDLEAALPGDPLGLVWAEGSFLIGQRSGPGGLLRVRRDQPESWSVVAIPVIEPSFRQALSFWGLAWNGADLVANADAAWFGGTGWRFVRLERRGFRIVDRRPAPDHLGALAWDGESYWAATRRDTEDSPQEAWLYRLDRDFRVTARYEPPGVGCQGLAWDGEHLWFADVFRDTLSLLAVDADGPRLLHEHRTSVSYLSGLAFDGRHLWATEYGAKRLLRLHPALLRTWAGARWLDPGAPEEVRVSDDSSARAELARRAPATPAAELRRRLRAPDPRIRVRARADLDALGLPVDFARDEAAFAEEPADEPVVVRGWQVELDGDELLAGWEIDFDPVLFEARPVRAAAPIRLPRFARFTLRVEGGSLRVPVEREVEAMPGRNAAERQRLAAGLGAGVYRAALFVHVQYVDHDGIQQILDRSVGTLEVER